MKIENEFPKISIIIPVYNVMEYLVQCIESILSQSFEEYEILLIDDGSTDESSAICDEYAKKYYHIRVFHQINRGVSAARNVGIQRAKGSYITFVDADDTIASNSLNQIENIIAKFPLDIYIFNSFSSVDRINGVKNCYPFPINQSCKICSGIDMFRLYRRGSVCGNLFNRAFLIENNIYFSTAVKNGEDSLFFSLCMVYAQKMAHFPICFYLVYEREGSASRIWSFDRVLYMTNSLAIIKELLLNRTLCEKQQAVLHLQIYQFISQILFEFFRLKKISGYWILRSKIKKNSLLPIPLKWIPAFRLKIMLLNTSFSLFSFCFLTRRFCGK